MDGKQDKATIENTEQGEETVGKSSIEKLKTIKISCAGWQVQLGKEKQQR